VYLGLAIQLEHETKKQKKMKIFFTTTNVLRSILLGKTERYRTERLRSGVKKNYVLAIFTVLMFW